MMNMYTKAYTMSLSVIQQFFPSGRSRIIKSTTKCLLCLFALKLYCLVLADTLQSCIHDATFTYTVALAIPALLPPPSLPHPVISSPSP